jgi:hypothetical protein
MIPVTDFCISKDNTQRADASGRKLTIVPKATLKPSPNPRLGRGYLHKPNQDRQAGDMNKKLPWLMDDHKFVIYFFPGTKYYFHSGDADQEISMEIWWYVKAFVGSDHNKDLIYYSNYRV